MEARNRKGEWKAIEYRPITGCKTFTTTSLKLNEREYVNFHVPIYSGPFKTSLRLKLNNRTQNVYSAEFDGSINESQFREPSIELKLRNYSDF